MNGYSQLLRYIKGTGQPLVNTITQGDIAGLDNNDTTIFPLLHVDVGNATFPAEGVIRFSVRIGCFGIRDSNPEPNTDRYYDNDNEIDNLNATMAILNRLWLLLLKDLDGLDIAAVGMPALEKCTEYAQNLLDGWIMALEIDVPNVTIDLCE